MNYETFYQLFVLVLNSGHVCDTCTCYNLSTYLVKLKMNISPQYFLPQGGQTQPEDLVHAK